MKKGKLPALTINFDSTKDQRVVLIAHTAEHGRLEVGSFVVNELFPLIEKELKSSEELQKKVKARTMARRAVIYKYNNRENYEQ